MKILIAPDSFKESLDAAGVASAIAAGWRDAMPQAELIELPLADGGEGTTAALVAATGGEWIPCRVSGPLGTPVDGFWGRLDARRAVVECAAASGLDQVPRELRDPWRATTRGLGELILAALDTGVREIIVGLGGSATNDGGAGMLQALGAQLLDQQGEPIGPGAEGLSQLARIELDTLDPRLAQVHFEVACDVDNPLTGATGAAAVFGPQKGADAALVARMDAALVNYARVIERCTGQQVAQLPGAGAAGGLGAALLAFLAADLKPGIEIVLEAVQLQQQLQGADLVITGEGRIDSQTVRGKTPVGVARRARAAGVPCIALGGSVPVAPEVLDALAAEGIQALFPILPGVVSLEAALTDARHNLRACARNLAAFWQLRRGF